MDQFPGPEGAETLADQVSHIFTIWNAYDIVKHRKITARMKRYINLALETYSMQDICNAIINYSKVIHDPGAWYKFTYSLDDFMAKKMEWFLDVNKPMERFYTLTARRKYSGDIVSDGEEYIPPASPGSPPVQSDNNLTERFLAWKERKEKKQGQ